MARIAELSATVTAETGDFERGLSNVEKAISGARTTIGGLDKDIKLMGRNMGSASDAMRGMGISLPITPMAALGQGIAIVGQQMKAAIDGAVEYAAQVRNLGRSIGATAEETSMLIQAADDVKVSFGSLSSALEAAIRKGVEPSIDGLGELADQYNAIQDPIAKTKFLMDNFGRSGADLAPLMEKGAAGIRELGEAARETGLVLSEEAVQSARDYEIAVDKLTDSWKGFSTQVGMTAIPMLTKLIDSTDKGWGAAKVMGTTVEEMAEKLQPAARGAANAAQAFDMMTGSQGAGIVVAEKLIRSLAEVSSATRKVAVGLVETGRAAGGMRDSFKFAYDAGMLLEMGLSGDLLNATEDYNKTMAETTLAIDEYHAAMAEGGKAAEEAAGTLEGLIAQQGLAEDAIRKATAEIVLQQVAMNLGAEGALEFAHATGIMSDADYELAKSIQRATEAADLNRDGEINSQAERARLLDLTLKLTDQTGDLATGTTTATTNMGLFDESLSPVEAGLKDTGLAAEHVTSAIDLIPPSVAVDTTPAMSSLDNATTSAYNFHRELDGIPRSITVDVITNNHTNYSGYQIPGAAAGADFIVPPGFPHDSYPMRVQSGEHVTVTPAGQQPRASGGDTYHVTINDRLAAALFKEQVRQRGLARAEALM